VQRRRRRGSALFTLPTSQQQRRAEAGGSDSRCVQWAARLRAQRGSGGCRLAQKVRRCQQLARTVGAFAAAGSAAERVSRAPGHRGLSQEHSGAGAATLGGRSQATGLPFANLITVLNSARRERSDRRWSVYNGGRHPTNDIFSCTPLIFFQTPSTVQFLDYRDRSRKLISGRTISL